MWARKPDATEFTAHRCWHPPNSPKNRKQKRPNVQVGDPFLEKLLLEACLEAMETGAVVAIQDMGAAGLTCSTTEMASRGGTGIEIDLARVPQRETGMTPYEIMLSESQERMLLVAEKGREREVLARFQKVGTRRGGRRLEVTDGGIAASVESRASRRRNSGASARGRRTGLSAPDRLRPSRREETADDWFTFAPPKVNATSRTISSACSRRPPSRRNAGSPSNTTRWCAPTRSPVPAPATRLSCASRERSAPWRFPPTATAAGAS